MQKSSSSSLPLYILIIGVLSLWLLAVGTVVWLVVSGFVKIDKLGQFGDAFGVWNALATGIAFCCALYAAMLQNRQILDSKAQFAEQIAIQERAIRESREQFAEELKLQQTQIEQAKLHFTEERQETARNLLRDKLEQIVERLDKLRELTGPVGRTVITDGITFDSALMEVVFKVLPAFSAVETLSHLYFSAHVKDLVPYAGRAPLHNDELDKLRAEFPSESKRKERLVSILNGLSSATSKCMVFAVDNSRGLVDGTLEKKSL